MNALRADLNERRAAASKDRLLEAGIRLFTSNAGQGLTIRELAREARVNHALISYHFGGVSELMNAVVERCIHDLRAMLIPEVDRFAERMRGENLERIPGLLVEYMDVLLGILSGPKGKALLKALSGPDSSSTLGVYSRFSKHVLQPLHRSFVIPAARLKNLPEQSLEASVLAQLMVAQCMAFFRGGGVVLAHLGKEAFTPDEMRHVGCIAAEALCRTAGFTGPMPTSAAVPLPAQAPSV